jgi:hypothetical protein
VLDCDQGVEKVKGDNVQDYKSFPLSSLQAVPSLVSVSSMTSIPMRKTGNLQPSRRGRDQAPLPKQNVFRWHSSPSVGGLALSLRIGYRGSVIAKIDRLKEEIGWLKVVFGVLVAIDASLLGWLAQNYATASRLLVLAGTVVTVVVTWVVVRVNRLAYCRIEQLEEV